MIDRRAFITLITFIGALCVTVVPRAWSQDAPKSVRVALIEAGAPSANQHFLNAFMAGMRELGYVPGKNTIVDVRWAEGQVEGFRRSLADVIALHPDVIVISSTLGAVEAKKATSTIPIVFIGVPDPVGAGLVSGLARPGGNLTGLARAAGDGLVGKTVQELKEIAPGVTRMAILWNPTASIEERRVQTVSAATRLRIVPLVVPVQDHEGIASAFTSMIKQHANGLFVVTDPLTLANRTEIVNLAAANHIPAVYEFGEFVRAGGLVAYAPSITEQFRRSALYVDKILHGANPAEIPIEQPTKFELVINLRSAKALGITVPQEMLLRADEVIQ